MGNSATTVEHGEGDEFAEFDGCETLGYRVLGVQPGSPAAQAGLVSFFDFIVGANGQMLLGSGEGLEEGEEYDDIDFPAMLLDHKDKMIELLVWNIKAQEKRLVELTPNDGWGGAGLLGVTIKLDDYGGADERLIRVLEVESDSPASQAGLIPVKDYLLGTTVLSFGSTPVLSSVLQDFVDNVVEIYVYNSDSDTVRVVALMPTFDWNGRGLLGAEVGTGYLHRLPNSCRGSLGLSVERKVRVMDEHSSGQASHEGEGNPRNQALELTPHLEMEMEKGEDNRPLHPEQVSKQPHELGSPPRGNEIGRQESNASISRPHVRRPPQFSEPVRQLRLSPTISHPNGKSPNLALSSSASVEDVEELFSGPPPVAATSGSPAISLFVPSPPKMQY